MQEIQTQQLDVRTADLGCAAAMVTMGFDIKEIDFRNLHRVIFVFDSTEEAQKAMDDYIFDKVQVSPLGFYNNVRTLRSRIFDGKQAILARRNEPSDPERNA
jgi:hypothetical protein